MKDKKKIGSTLILGLIVILLTGCFGGNETLHCTYEMDEMFFEQEMNFRNNRLSRTEISMTMDLEEEALSAMGMDLEEFKEVVREDVARHEEFDGVTASVDFHGNQMISRTIVDYNALDEDDVTTLIMMGIVFEDWNIRVDISETRAELEREGFTCR